MKLKRLVALGLATTMAFSGSVVAFANTTATTATANESQKVEATGKVEGAGIKNKDVFSVVLPAVTDSSVSITLDPELLITATDNAAHSNAEFEKGASLFFANDGGKFSSTSDAITITNKSSMSIDVSVTAKITGNTDAPLVADKTFGGSPRPAIYMAIVDERGETPIAEGSTGTEVTKLVKGAKEGSYKVTYSGSAYDYTLDSGADADASNFSSYTFSLTGACNTAADWSGLTSLAPNVELVWEIDKHNDATMTMDGKGKVTITGLTAEQNVIGNEVIALYDESFGAITANATQYEWVVQDGAWTWDPVVGGDAVLQLPNDYVEAYAQQNSNAGSKVTVSIQLTDGTIISDEETVDNK